MSALTSFDRVQPASGIPLYAAVRDMVHGAIDRGEIQPGCRLPSTKSLSEQLDVSLVTVHRALNELVASGVLRRGQGRGTFVHEDYAKPGHIASDTRFGLVFQPESSMADPYHGRVLQGVRDTATQHGIDLVLLRYNEDWRRECAGFIYVNPFRDQLDHPARFGGGQRANGRTPRDHLPFVAVGVNPEIRPGISVVDTDNVSMMIEAVELLAHNGHRRIAFLGADSSTSNDIDRERGFRVGCERAGLALDESLVLKVCGSTIEGPDAERLFVFLSDPQPPSAVVAGGYYLALGVYTAARCLGLRIPRDLSVIGVDDPPSAPCLSPPLTTFWQPLEEMGQRAVLLLKDQIGRQEQLAASPREQLVLGAQLKLRESVGPAEPAGGPLRSSSRLSARPARARRVP